MYFNLIGYCRMGSYISCFHSGLISVCLLYFEDLLLGCILIKDILFFPWALSQFCVFMGDGCCSIVFIQ